MRLNFLIDRALKCVNCNLWDYFCAHSSYQIALLAYIKYVLE